MAYSQAEAKLAVESGYWFLYRYIPERKAEGNNPFILDSAEPKQDLEAFLMGEVRYASLRRTFPELADDLLAKAERFSKERFAKYKALSEKE